MYMNPFHYKTVLERIKKHNATLGTNKNLSENENHATMDMREHQDRLTSKLTDANYWPEQIELDK